MSAGRHHLQRAAVALVALVAAGVGVDVALPRATAFAGSNVAPTLLQAAWTQGTPISLPANAGSGAAPSLQSVSCYAAGNCSAAGSYKDTTSSTQAMVVTEADNAWNPATEVLAPTDAGGQPDSSLDGISCVNAVDCTAVGSYQAAVGEQEAMAATEADGTWGRAARVSAPAGAATDPEADLVAVSCANAGACVAVGSYQDSSAATQAMVVTASGGEFAIASEVSPPAGAGATPETTLSAISCFRTDDCTAVGSYVDSSGDTQALELTETGGVWASAAELTAPSNADGDPDAVLDSVSCTSALDCTAFGSYRDASGNEQAMAATDLGGTWSQAVEITPPANASPDPEATLTAGSCTGAVTCAAVGTYLDLSAHTQAMLVVEQGGTWSEAGELAAANDAGVDPQTQMDAISCPSEGSCAAVGDYSDLSGNPEAATFTEVESPTFADGVPASYTVVSIGSPTPALTESGALPAGVSFADEGDGFGTISGTPGAGTVGSSSFTVAADNGVGIASSQAFTAVVDESPAFTSAASTTFTVGTAGSFQFTTDAFPAATYTEDGTLPAGISLSSSGLLQGTPGGSAGGSYPITVTASDGIGTPAAQRFTLSVTQATQSISSTSSATFTVGSAGSFAFAASGGTATASFTESGTLPQGVTLSPAGVLSGIPAAGTGGQYPIAVSASDGIGAAVTQDFVLTVDQAPAITSAGNATFTVGNAGSVTLLATGYPAPAFTESGTLPSGVALAGGVLSGTPTASSASGGNATTTTSSGGSGTTATAPVTSYPITVTATNSAGTATQSFTLTVNQAPTFTSSDTTSFVAGQANTDQVTAGGLPSPTFSETGALPPGVTLSSSGVLSGVPANGSGGQYFVTITAANGIGTPATQLFTLNVDSPPKITSADRTVFVLNEIDAFTVSASGFPASTYTVSGTLPAGVIFVNDEFTGVPTGGVPTGAAPTSSSTSGTPATTTGTTGTTTGTSTSTTKVPTTYPVTLTASNGIGATAVQTFEIVLKKAPPATPAAAAPEIVGGTVEALGGAKPKAVPVAVSCPKGRCTAVLELIEPAVAGQVHGSRQPSKVPAGKTGATDDELLGSASVKTAKAEVVHVLLNPTGRALFATAARHRQTLKLDLVETSGKAVERLILNVRA